jgi:tetratricopeptide (TPR) repeat protein
LLFQSWKPELSDLGRWGRTATEWDFLANYAWAEGKDADMEKELQNASGNPQGDLTVMGFRGSLACARGQVRRCRELMQKGADALDRLHFQGRAGMEANLAGVEALVGNDAEAVKDANEALRLSRAFNVIWPAANILAVERQEQKALALADEIQRTRPNDVIAQNVAVPMIRALATLLPANRAKADPAKAVDLFNTAALYVRANTGILFGRGLAYKHAGRYAEAQQDFQRILDLRPFTGPDVLSAVAQLELGRVYQQQGDTAKARIAYQNFLAAWKDADPDVPLLREAKAEYSKLQ